MTDLSKELSLLLRRGNLGVYKYAKVDQVVLLSDGKALNYFTNITVSSRFKSEEPFQFLTSSPKSITKGVKLAISTYTIPIVSIKQILCSAAKTGKWVCNDETVFLDSTFVTHRKYIPENDPAISKYNCFVPVEWYLYGSNFWGNYYLVELFSKKERIKEIIGPGEIDVIQKYINDCRLKYNLSKLTDRIGNVVCKIEVESLSYKPTALGYDHGIGLEFAYTKTIAKRGLTLTVMQENDEAVYTFEVNPTFKDETLFIPPNQCKTQISLTDNKTGLILYMGLFDYRVYSGYYSHVGLSHMVSTIANSRTLHFPDHDETVELSGVSQIGNRYEFIEMALSSERRKAHEDEWFEEYGYFRAYSENQHNKAIADIIEIINAKDLLWDLEEIYIIDPYLTSKDLAATVFFCKKPNIRIKALCSFQTIKSNKETKSEINASSHSAYVEQEKAYIESVLGANTDIRLEFRTIANGHGLPFHDRYIILNFNINKSRAWMLGSSINSIGSAHSVIQIVEAPNKIVELFRNQWELTDDPACIIFDNSKH